MKERLLSLLLIPLTLLTSCQKSEDSSIKDSDFTPYYNEVEDLHINWKDIFLMENEIYRIYVYSVTCTPCSMLREKIINYALKEGNNLYFIYPSDEDVPFVDDEELADSSLGATSIENIYCYSTPTLIEINNKVVTYYSHDYYQIEAYVA